MRISFIIITVLLLSSCSLTDTNNEREQEERALIFIENSNYDYGVLEDTAKTIYHTFKFVNNSNDTCHIVKILKSCGCTQASCKNSTIPPKCSTDIDIVIDIESFYNEIYKTISVITSHSSTPIEASISAFKRMPKYLINSQFPYRLGDNIRLSSTTVFMGYVPHGETVSKSINIINNSDKTIHLKYSLISTEKELISCFVPEEVEAGEITKIVFTYDASEINDIWGEHDCALVLREGQTVDTLNGYGIITEKIIKERGKNPKITISYLPDIKETNNDKQWCYHISNKGKNTLKIMDVQASLSFAKTIISNKKIPQNESAILYVTIPKNSLSRINYIDIGISSNDPIEPYKILRIPVK